MWGLAFDPTGERLVTSGQRGIIKIWDVKTGQDLMDIPDYAGTAANPVFSPDGSRLVIVGADGVHIWNLDTQEKLLELHIHTSYINGLAFNKDWSQMATASLDGTTRVIYLNIDDLIKVAKSRITRSLTTAECRQYLHLDACPTP
jgi:WD40 repeat protein